MKTALVVVFEEFEELEAVAPIDILRRAEAKVTVATLGNSLRVVGRSQIALEADELFSEASKREFDALLVIGGAGVRKVENNPELLNAVRAHFETGKIVGAICAAPLVLKNAGILVGKKFTAHDSVLEILPDADSSRGVVADANVITSRGAGTAVNFGLEVVRAMFSEEKSTQIAKSICFR